MRNGFKFNNRHSSQYGVTVRTKSRPIRPSAKSFTADMPCRDGVYDFSMANPSEREFFNERIFTVTLSVCADGLRAMQERLTKLSLWLTGSGELIFDDMPLIVWRGRITDEIIYMPEHDGKKAVMEITFRVKPFGECIFGSEGPALDTVCIRLDENIPIGFDELYTFTISCSGDLRIINFGDRPARPVLDITGSAAGVRLELGGRSLSFNASGNVKVDFEKQNVTDENGSISVSGEFFEFQRGNNLLHIENSNTSSLQISVSYTPEFMYDVYFDDMEWGAANA